MTSNVGNQLSVPTHDLEKAMEGYGHFKNSQTKCDV